MSRQSLNLPDQITHHYQAQSHLANFMIVRNNDNQNFDQIPYTARLDNTPIPTTDFEIDNLAETIAREIVNREFAHFVSSLGQVQNNTTETTLANLVETLVDVFNDLWDNGFEPNQIFLPFSLNQEIRQRRDTRSRGIDFGVVTLNPILVRELGENQIFFADNRCFEKIYPTRISDQLRIFIRHQMRSPEIDCTITQKLNIRNIQAIARLVVTDVPNIQS